MGRRCREDMARAQDVCATSVPEEVTRSGPTKHKWATWLRGEPECIPSVRRERRIKRRHGRNEHSPTGDGDNWKHARTNVPSVHCPH